MARQTPDQKLLLDLGARMASIRHDRGLTQADVAEAAELDAQSYQRAERGRISLSLPRLRRVAQALGVPLGDLFVEANEVPVSPWVEDDAAAAAAWRRIPGELRALALRVLRDFGDAG